MWEIGGNGFLLKTKNEFFIWKQHPANGYFGRIESLHHQDQIFPGYLHAGDVVKGSGSKCGDGMGDTEVSLVAVIL